MNLFIKSSFLPEFEGISLKINVNCKEMHPRTDRNPLFVLSKFKETKIWLNNKLFFYFLQTMLFFFGEAST